MKQVISEKESRIIYILKAFAIISVVCAHISLVPENFSKSSVFVCTLLNEIGAIGVGVFYCVSGYLFVYEKEKKNSFTKFLLKKLKTIGIPWIISASLVYCYVAIRKGGSLQEWLLSVVGYMSSYWFLTVLFVLYIIYYFVQKSKYDKVLVIVLGGASVASIILRVLGIIEQDSLGVYLNIFNWSIFFSVGYLVNGFKKGKKSIIFEKKMVAMLTIFSIGLLVGLPAFDLDKFSYFYWGYIPIELIIIGALIGWANLISDKERKILLVIGKMSFSIYLYNELLWAGLVVNLGNRIDFWPILFMRPVIVLIAVIIELLVGRWLFGLIKKTSLFDMLTGVKL